MNPILEVRALTAGYDGVTVIRDLNFSVHEGVIATIVGANGAGKTTTMRALSGVLRAPKNKGTSRWRYKAPKVRCSTSQRK